MRTSRRVTSSTPPSAAQDLSRGSGTRTKFELPAVLIVDDLEDNRDLFATVLRDAGFVVTTASDGVDALEIAAVVKPRVVIMDLAMPRMDGFDAIEALRREEHGRDVYIIVVSAFADRASRTRAMELGANAFLKKPLSPAELVEQIRLAVVELKSPRVAAG